MRRLHAQGGIFPSPGMRSWPMEAGNGHGGRAGKGEIRQRSEDTLDCFKHLPWTPLRVGDADFSSRIW